MDKKLRLSIVFVGYVILLYMIYLTIDRLILPNITSGAANTTVPSVIGKKLNDAEKLLNTKGLDIEVAKEVYNEAIVGSIVTQSPASKSVVKEGRYIYVTVSKGKELVAVPYIIGIEMRTAKINLMKTGLELGTISYKFDDNTGKNKIISQSHKAGVKVPYGSTINIVISKGAEQQIKVPYLIGLSLDEAKVLIAESGLILGSIEQVEDGTFITNTILKQFPLPGEIASNDTEIQLTIAR